MKRKPFEIPKAQVWRAWLMVKRAGGGAGIDGETIETYEENLSRNLYKLWNRLSSGSYFPSPVGQRAIPKAGGGRRVLGIPTIADRVAQTTLRLSLEPRVEKVMLAESFGARPGRSAHQAVAVCRARCWKRSWVVDLDIKSYFDSVDHELLLKAVDLHAETAWEKLYIRRLLRAPTCTPGGQLVESEGRGIAQGGPLSPLLANLFLHYALDRWLKEHHPHLPFERYLDDCIIHCGNERQARRILADIRERLAVVRLALNEEKTKIVWCGQKGKGKYRTPHSFTFLGFEFKPRRRIRRNGAFDSTFSPGVGTKGEKKLIQNIKAMHIFKMTRISIDDLAQALRSRIRGWMNYFCAFRPSCMRRVLTRLNLKIVRWLSRKHKCSWSAAYRMLKRIATRNTLLFPHWSVCSPAKWSF